ncbi:putative VID27-involved in vacuole import and degradation [Jaminaea rosea]|uniref:Putative VID27-involved in vacuole import and degradation n=1 Tax=Jaminaea rosea TaxID=1569628 RepID=A0A316UMK6_9BASI|nr:putative VID27-involved in vacuole import and degradation [Jaminaea rosea]PWN24405.1 putative VID27-involved in vacuole import and degradation [Jaminaea rosea]
MFMLKSIFGKIWGDNDNVELIQIPAGALFLVRPSSVKGSRECIYKDAVATIRRTPTEFNYQLVVTRAYDEGEQQLLDEDDESDDERSFLIDQGLEFRASTSPEGDPTYVWRDLSGVGDSEDVLEFVMDDAQVNSVTRSIFEVTYLQCVYERKYQRSHDAASDADLEELKPAAARGGIYPATPAATPAAKGKAKAEEAADVKATPAKATPAKTTPAKPLVPAAPEESFPIAGEPDILLETTADLYLYDQSSGLFMSQEKGVKAQVAEAGRFLYWLSISSPSRRWLSQRLEGSMNINFASDSLSSVWNYFDGQRRCYSWLLRFRTKEEYDEYQRGFAKLMWETLNEERWEKSKPDEQQYAIDAYEDDVEMTDAGQESAESEGEDERAVDRYIRDDDRDAREASASMQEEEEDPEDDAKNVGDAPAAMPAEAGEHDRNSQLAVGYKFDRSFVVRGNRIGVFKHTEDDQLEFATTINNVRTPKGKSFNPRKVMLHDQDSAMVLMDPTNEHSLFKMDLEYGKIVDEWRVHDDVRVNNVVPNSKFAQTTGEQMLIGHSHNGVFRIDPRLGGNKMVDSQFKQYATKAGFSSAATDEKGRLAVASTKGELRLFDQIGKNAKTALPALGDPILGVDVTADGRYVVATCKTYLLLIDTLIGDGRYKGECGFDRPFPKESKPIPRRLQLKPHHVAYMDSEISFTPARFDTNVEGSETSIVTATGSYVVSWPLERVKRGRTDGYTLRKLGDVVVEDNFAFGSSNNIIVAMPDDLQLHRRGQLQKPSRQSLLRTPAGKIRNSASGSGIVEQRY